MTLRFKVKDEDTAKKIILTPEPGISTEQRWENETEWLAKYLFRFVNADPHATFVDFGCGIGRASKVLHELSSELEVFGIESSFEMRDLARKYNPNFMFHLLPDFCGLVDGEVDFAMALYALQHVHGGELQEVIDNLHRTLKPGGNLFIINLKGRAVPQNTSTEIIAQTDGNLNEAILKIATQNSKGAWYDDGLNVVDMLKEKFGEPTLIEPDHNLVGEFTRKHHDFVIFTK